MSNQIGASTENCNAHVSADEILDDLFDLEGDDSEVVPYQAGIAVRGDEQGNIVIRQDDQFIDVGREWVVQVCAASVDARKKHDPIRETMLG